MNGEHALCSSRTRRSGAGAPGRAARRRWRLPRSRPSRRGRGADGVIAISGVGRSTCARLSNGSARSGAPTTSGSWATGRRSTARRRLPCQSAAPRSASVRAIRGAAPPSRRVASPAGVSTTRARSATGPSTSSCRRRRDRCRRCRRSRPTARGRAPCWPPQRCSAGDPGPPGSSPTTSAPRRPFPSRSTSAMSSRSMRRYPRLCPALQMAPSSAGAARSTGSSGMACGPRGHRP